MDTDCVNAFSISSESHFSVRLKVLKRMPLMTLKSFPITRSLSEVVQSIEFEWDCLDVLLKLHILR